MLKGPKPLFLESSYEDFTAFEELDGDDYSAFISPIRCWIDKVCEKMACPWKKYLKFEEESSLNQDGLCKPMIFLLFEDLRFMVDDLHEWFHWL